MRVIIGCEFSGIIREAFKARGADAWSCDILETEIPGNHIQDDILKHLDDGWDLMIAHPPCTYLSYAGMANWYDEGRAMKRIKAAEFFMKLWEAPIEHICVENPHGIMTKIFRPPDQVIHPWYFGEKQMKRTCLWLKNLPKLQYRLEDDLFGRRTATDKPEPIQVTVRKKTGRINKRYYCDATVSDAFKNWKNRSRSFVSIAEAMAEQWTQYLGERGYNCGIRRIRRLRIVGR